MSAAVKLADIRAALADTVGVLGIETHAYAPTQINAPAVFVGSPTGRDEAQGNQYSVNMPLWLVVSRSITSWQIVLDEYIETTRDLLYENDDLGIGVGVHMVTWDSYGEITLGGETYWAVRLNVVVSYG